MYRRTRHRVRASKCRVTRYPRNNTLTRATEAAYDSKLDALKRVDAVGRGRVTRVVPGRWVDPVMSAASDRNGGMGTLANIKNMHSPCFDNVPTGSRPASRPLATSFAGVM